MKSRNSSNFVNAFSPKLEVLLENGYLYRQLLDEEKRLIDGWEKARSLYHQSVVETLRCAACGEIISEVKS